MTALVLVLLACPTAPESGPPLPVVVEAGEAATYRGQLYGEAALCRAAAHKRACEVERDRWRLATLEARVARAHAATEAEVGLRACASSLRFAEAALEAVPPPPSRLLWLGVGAGSLAAPVAAGVVLDWPGWATATGAAGGLAVSALIAWALGG